jgi:hypothetical protein
MPAADIAKRNEAERLDWQKRGVSGVVAARKGNEITLKIRSLLGETQAVVTAGEKTTFRRYAPDSVKFADARQSNLAEVSVGDQLRARGEKSEDGSKVAAQEIIFGTFLTKAGKIATVNPQTREIAIVELNTNKPLLVKLTADSQLKRMPNFPAMGGGMPGGSMPGGPPAGGTRPGGMTGGPPTGTRPPDLAQMLERMPQVKLEDLQPGQTIVVSSTKGATKDELTAIMVLADAGMLIRLASTQTAARGAQGVAGQMGGMGGAGMAGGASGGLSGGLEGMQLPGIMP